ncbi:hypothetical protein EPN83_01625 [Patescibacteria group bacterium]|nr:MAG: hypothetical protein EPN83_01625 [Patescibacteria group bacterium]
MPSILDRFTDRVRKILVNARYEAVRLHREYVGTEHILLALIREENSVAVAALLNLNVNLERIEGRIRETLLGGRASPILSFDIPYTTRTRVALELASDEARDLGCAHIGAEHILLGLMRDTGGLASQILSDAGATLEGVRAEVRRLSDE